MSRERPPADDLFLVVCDFSTLERAITELERRGMKSCPGFLSAEERLINLQNNLLWGLYQNISEENNLAILAAVHDVMERHRLVPSALTGRTKALYTYFGPEQEGGGGYV